MRILLILHAEFEKPGSIETWAKKNSFATLEVRPYKGEKLPNVNDFDFLVVMGGPQSPLEIEKALYLNDEINLIKQAIVKQKRIIGICLGAQLIGEALGAKTERSPNREVGMYLVEMLNEAKFDPIFSQFPETFDVMHWHSDMPGVPDGAVLLAKSEGCPRQIFRFGDRIYGFQCHFELTQDLVKDMIEKCPNDLKAGTYIRSEKELLYADYSQINAKMDKILNYLAQLPEIALHKKIYSA